MPIAERRRIIRDPVAGLTGFFAFCRAAVLLFQPQGQLHSHVCNAEVGLPRLSVRAVLTCVLSLILLVTGFIAPVQARNLITLPPYNLTLAWDSNPDDGVGYRVYYGTASRSYTFTNDVGSSTAVTLQGLQRGVTYFLAVTAYDASGVESDFSEELSYARPIPTLQGQSQPSRELILTLAGPPGQTNEVLATQTFLNWEVIGVVTFGTDGFAQFTDYGATNYQTRFYRTQERQPWSLKSRE